jgi:hypothetical protein
VAAVNTDRSNSVPNEYGPLMDDEYDDDAELLWQLFSPALVGVALILVAAAAAVVELAFG